MSEHIPKILSVDIQLSDQTYVTKTLKEEVIKSINESIVKENFVRYTYRQQIKKAQKLLAFAYVWTTEPNRRWKSPKHRAWSYSTNQDPISLTENDLQMGLILWDLFIESDNRWENLFCSAVVVEYYNNYRTSPYIVTNKNYPYEMDYSNCESFHRIVCLVALVMKKKLRIKLRKRYGTLGIHSLPDHKNLKMPLSFKNSIS